MTGPIMQGPKEHVGNDIYYQEKYNQEKPKDKKKFYPMTFQNRILSFNHTHPEPNGLLESIEKLMLERNYSEALAIAKTYVGEYEACGKRMHIAMVGDKTSDKVFRGLRDLIAKLDDAIAEKLKNLIDTIKTESRQILSSSPNTELSSSPHTEIRIGTIEFSTVGSSQTLAPTELLEPPSLVRSPSPKEIETELQPIIKSCSQQDFTTVH